MVIVQPSIYVTDNSCTLDALRRLGARARALLEADPQRCLWGSDWPHPLTGVRDPGKVQPFDAVDDVAAFARLSSWAGDATLFRNILVDGRPHLRRRGVALSPAGLQGRERPDLRCAGKPVLHRSGGLSGGRGPDGMAIDQAGGLAVAHVDFGTVWIFSHRGEALHRVQSCRTDMVANVAYKGNELYITDSGSGCILRARVPTPGRTLYSHL